MEIETGKYAIGAKQLYGTPTAITAAGVFTANQGNMIIFYNLRSAALGVIYQASMLVTQGNTFDLSSSVFDSHEETYAQFLMNCFTEFDEVNADDVLTVELVVDGKGQVVYSVTPSSITYAYDTNQDAIKFGDTSEHLEFKSKDRPSVVQEDGGIHGVAYISDVNAAVSKALPSAPQEDGTYTLTCTVTDGVAAYSWT